MNIQKDLITIFGICLFLLTPIGVFDRWYNGLPETIVLAAEPEVQELGVDVKQEATPTPTPTFDNEIESYVYEVFGEDYEEAFEIIQCESSWNTQAYNDNTWWGGVGQDRGLWQINNIYHPISDECAYDYKCSTDYSYRMFVNDNKSFVRWTCGR